jgi:hypothetical protein
VNGPNNREGKFPTIEGLHHFSTTYHQVFLEAAVSLHACVISSAAAFQSRVVGVAAAPQELEILLYKCRVACGDQLLWIC